MQDPNSLPAQPPAGSPPPAGAIALHQPRALQTQLLAREEAQAQAEADDEIDLKAIFKTLLKHKWTIVGSTLLCTLAAAVYTLRITPQYESTALLQIERAAQKVVGFNSEVELDQGASAEALSLRTQIELLQSRTLAERVIDELGLAKRSAALPGGEGAADNAMSEGALPGVETEAAEPGFFAMLQANFAQLFTPSTRNERALTRADTLSAFEKAVKIEPIRNSRLVEIQVMNSDAELSARIANSMAKAFIAINLERKMESSVYARQFLEDQIKQTKARLEESERVINEYAKKNSILSLGEKTSATTQNFVDFSSALARAEQDRFKAESQYNEVRSNPESAPQVLDNLAIQTYKEQKARLDAEYAKNLSIYKPGFPAMVQLKAQIDGLDARIKAEVRTILASIKGQFEAAKRQEDMLRQRVAASRQEVLTVQDRSVDMNLLQRELDTNRQVYDSLLQRLKEVSVTGGLTTNNVSIVDEAQAPLFPAKPKPLINLALGILLGGFLGMLAALLREQMDDSIKHADEIEGFFGLPLLGWIPHTKRPKGGPEAVALLAHSDPRSAFSEAYRSMRTALQFSTTDGAPKRFMVTSCSKSEGKTTTALALAINFAQLGQHVLLIDADMRKASVHKALGLPNERGLSNLLSGDVGTEKLILATRVPNLGVLTAGPTPPDPVELLMGPKLGLLLDKAEALGFKQVIIDGPPLLGIADAVVLGNQIQHIIFAVKASETKKNSVKDALRRLRNAGLQPMGVALTHARTEHTSDYAYEAYYGYGDDVAAAKPARVAPAAVAAASAGSAAARLEPRLGKAEGPEAATAAASGPEMHLGAASAEDLLKQNNPFLKPHANGQKSAPRAAASPPPGRRSRNSHGAPRWAAGAVAATVLLGGAAWWLWPSAPATEKAAVASSAQVSGPVTEAPAAAPAAAVVAAAPQEGAAVATMRADEVETEAAPVAATAAPTALPTPSAAPPDLAELKDGPADTWPALARLWGESLAPSNACDNALAVKLQCFRLSDATLSDLQTLDRPGLVQLSQGATQRWVLLRGLDAATATLTSGEHTWQLPTPGFEQQWTGRYSTLWRLPPGHEARVFAASEDDTAGRWLNDQFKALQSANKLAPSADRFAARVRQFQKQYGLPADGNALPIVFVRLNRLVGLDEPRLASGG
jgi:capsular exopolysaccharide synthesis family protein